jgi:hypothetical protein
MSTFASRCSSSTNSMTWPGIAKHMGVDPSCPPPGSFGF